MRTPRIFSANKETHVRGSWEGWAVCVLFLLVFAASAALPLGSLAAAGEGLNAPSEQVVSVVPTLAGGDLYALVVGISKYKNKAIPALKVAANDAKKFAEFLGTQKELFKDTKVTLLLNEQATKAELEKYLFYELRKAGKDDTVFVFLSGHGAIDPKRAGEFFFLSHDADPDFLEVTALNMSGLRFLKKMDCPRVVLVADACHAGGFSKWRTKAAVIPIKNFINDFSSSAGRVVISSSRPDEYSLEAPRMENSVFTHYFLKGVEGAADADSDGVVTINEAYRYVYDRTKVETEGAQHPQFEGAVEGVFPLALTVDLRGRPVTTLQILADPPAAEVFVGGRLVGKTNPDGSIYLKYLPLGRPVAVKLRKEGWMPKEVGPFIFSKGKLHHKTRPLKLKPALASLEIRTTPGRVAVKIDGRSAGTTGRDGRLIVHGIQVAVPHTIELRKTGFEDDSLMLSVPLSFIGKKFKRDKITLARSARDRPAIQRVRDRVQQFRRERPRQRDRDAERPRKKKDSFSTAGDSERLGL